jgi:hypothetical protein
MSAGGLLLLLLATACVPRFLIRSGVPDVVVVANTPTSTQITPTGADAHFVQMDDYFIMEEPLGTGNDWVYATLAKMRQPAGAGTNNQAKFVRARDDAEVWTAYYLKTRTATAADLVLGRQVIAFDAQDGDGIYRSPASGAEARAGYWFTARITDLSELYRNVVGVGDGRRVRQNALRVVVNQGG